MHDSIHKIVVRNSCNFPESCRFDYFAENCCDLNNVIQRFSKGKLQNLLSFVYNYEKAQLGSVGGVAKFGS